MWSGEKKYSDKVSERKEFLGCIFHPLLHKIVPQDSKDAIQKLLKAALAYSKKALDNAVAILVNGSENGNDSDGDDCDTLEMTYDENDQVVSMNDEKKKPEPDNSDVKDVESSSSSSSNTGESEPKVIPDEDKKEVGCAPTEKGKEVSKKNAVFVEAFVHNLLVYPTLFTDFFLSFISCLTENLKASKDSAPAFFDVNINIYNNNNINVYMYVFLLPLIRVYLCFFFF